MNKVIRIGLNPSRHAVTGIEQLDRARIIQRSLGTLIAARYMRARDWSFESTLYWLAQSNQRPIADG